MDVNDIRGIAIVLIMISFLGVCFWAFSAKNKKRFDEAKQLPFADDDINNDSQQEKSNHE